MPTFDPTIPQATDFVSDSQQNLLDNNVALNDSFGVNHIRFSQAANNGKHTFVQMRILPSSTPSIPGAATNEGTIFTRSVAGTPQLFYTNSVSAREYKLTNVVTNAAAAADFPLLGAPTNGWTWMGQGIILQYGSIAAIGATNVSFSVPFVGDPYAINVTLNKTAGSSVAFSVNGQTSIGFSINQGTVSLGDFYYWTAVGKYGG